MAGPAQVAIVHGWSDSAKSFLNLRQFLIANGYQATQIWLSDYVSTDDDVRIEDVAARMDHVIGGLIREKKLASPFDMIVHSTGGLVAREWITRFYFEREQPCPVRRLVMLAPANFGSRLASMGKSMIGRLAKGWDNWFQTGTEMLSGLELASAYQWRLARRDLFAGENDATSPYGPDKVMPFVIIGSRGYPKGLRQIVNEHGSDGTVRCCAANLNVSGFTIDFSRQGVYPDVSEWTPRGSDLEFPFLVLPDRDHSSIIDPLKVTSNAGTSGELGGQILAALACDTEQDYRTIAADWSARTEAVSDLAVDGAVQAAFVRDAPAAESFHQYMQIVTRVLDDHGQPVPDFFVEFFSPDYRENQEAIYFHTEVLEHVHVNSANANMRSFYVDRTDLMQNYYGTIGDVSKRVMAMSLSAAHLGRNIHYFDDRKVGAKGSLVIHRESDAAREIVGGPRLRRNRTHLVEIVIPRRPVDRVFTIGPLPDKGQPAPST